MASHRTRKRKEQRRRRKAMLAGPRCPVSFAVLDRIVRDFYTSVDVFDNLSADDLLWRSFSGKPYTYVLRTTKR